MAMVLLLLLLLLVFSHVESKKKNRKENEGNYVNVCSHFHRLKMYYEMLRVVLDM